MPTQLQYIKQTERLKLMALAEYERRKKLTNDKLCERCIRLELAHKEKRAENYKCEITFGSYLIDWK